MPAPALIEVRFLLSDYMTPGRVKFAASVKELQSLTNEFSQKHRPGCVARLLSSEPKELKLKYNVTCKESYSNPNGHEVNVAFDTEAVTDVTKAGLLDVKVNCDCEAFLYWGAQWNLHQTDSLLGEARPLLVQPTEELDKRGKFYICKHVATVMERILPSVQHNIVKILREESMKRRKEEESAKPPAPKAPSRTEQRQQEMRERMEKQRSKQKTDKTLRDKLLKGIERRTKDHVVERTAPAAPEEKEHIKGPIVTPTDVVEESNPKPPAVPVEEVVEPVTPVVPDKQVTRTRPAAPSLTKKDQDAVSRLMQEESDEQEEEDDAT